MRANRCADSATLPQPAMCPLTAPPRAPPCQGPEEGRRVSNAAADAKRTAPLPRRHLRPAKEIRRHRPPQPPNKLNRPVPRVRYILRRPEQRVRRCPPLGEAPLPHEQQNVPAVPSVVDLPLPRRRGLRGRRLRLPVHQLGRDRIVLVERRRRVLALRLTQVDEEQVGVGRLVAVNASVTCAWRHGFPAR